MTQVPNVVSDVSLVGAVAQGSQAALAEIYRRYSGLVWTLCTRVCRDTQLAEEVCQMVFCELWSSPRRFDPARGGFRSWLLAQSHARAVDVVRSEAARRRREEHDARLTPRRSVDVEITAHLQAMTGSVRRAVEELSSGERAAIALTYFGGYSYREAARLLRLPEGTVKSRIRAGLRQLRRALESEGVTP